jgi:hypothetical protein
MYERPIVLGVNAQRAEFTVADKHAWISMIATGRGNYQVSSPRCKFMCAWIGFAYQSAHVVVETSS